MTSRFTALVLVGLLVVAGGCTGTDSSSTTVAQTETGTPTQTSIQTSSDSNTSSTNPTPAGISVKEGNNSDSVLLDVRANTSLNSTDPEDENPGEPYFVIKVDGEQVKQTPEVERSNSGRYTFELASTSLRQSGSEMVSVTVVLMDQDTVFDDAVRTWSTSVDSITASTTSSVNGDDGEQSTKLSDDDTTRTAATTTDGSITTVPTTRTTTTSVEITRATTTTAETTRITATTSKATRTTTTTTTVTPTTETADTDSSQSSYTVTIVEIVDGDTADVEYQNGSTERVRFLGVDTPEVHADNDPVEFEDVPNTEAGANCLRDWGHKASEFTRNELRGEQVTITFDENEGRRGSYGRLLVYIHHDGELFNHQLVAQGYARMYDSDFTKRDSFSSTESSAQRDSIGLWGCTDAKETTTKSTTTSDSSSGSEGLSVAQIHADAPGNDHENLNEEYIVFENTGDDTLDLSGWVLADDADHTYSFPSGFTLESGETVTVYTGSGSNSDSELYWESGRAVWNNGGDTIIVTNADGNMVIKEEYSG